MAQWLPAAGLAAFGAALLVGGEQVLAAVYANSDAASPPVLADCLSSGACGGGHVLLGHMPYFSTLWFDFLTGVLPSHRVAWELWPYALSVLGAGVLARAAWRLGTGWTALTSAVIALAVSSATLYATSAQAFHGTTWFVMIVLGAFLVRRSQSCSGSRRGRAMDAGAISLLAGVNLASDPLLALAGIVPLALAPAVVWLRTRSRSGRSLAITAAGTAGASVVVALITNATMHALGFAAAPQRGGLVALTSLDHLPYRLLRFGESLGALVNAGPLDHAGPLVLVARLLLIGGALWAVAVAVREPWRGLLRKTGGSAAEAPRTVYLTYWSIASSLLCLAYVFSDAPLASPGSPTSSTRYLIGLVYAGAAALPLAVGGTRRGRVACGLALSLLCALSTLALVRDDLGPRTRVPIITYGNAIVTTLESLELDRGYAGYWQAAPLSWLGRGDLLVAPVHRCAAGRRLCPTQINSISSWYTQRGSRATFLLTDSHGDRSARRMLRALGRPRLVKRFGSLSLFLYGYDIASRFGKPAL